jgi:hypothetical protein
MEIKFGKYSGKRIDQIEDLGYLKWLLKTDMKPSLRFWNTEHVKAVKEKIKQIEYYAK